MGTNYIAPIWRMPENANKDKLSNYNIDFDGVNQSIQANNFTSLSGKSNFSMSLWLKASPVPAVGTGTTFQGNLLNLTPSGVNDTKIYVVIIRTSTSPNVYRLDVYVQSLAFRANISDPTTDWTNLIITYNSNEPAALDRCKVYQDGSKITNTNAANVSAVGTADTLTIGLKHTRTNWFDHFFGSMSQLAIFDYTLTDGTNGTVDQISYLNGLNNPMAITGGEPIAYYPLGDNSNPNSLSGYPNISVGADSVFDFIPHDYINLGDPDLLSFGNSVNDSPFTMSAWIKTTGNGDGIISKWGGSPSGYEWIFYIVGNKIRVALYDATTSNYQRRDGVTIVNTGEWVHVLTTYDGRGGNGTNENTANQGIKIYVNGVEESSYTNGRAGNYVAMHNTIRPVQIGTYNTTSSVGFDGEMTNVQIWRTDLTAPEVLTVYNNGQPLMTGTQPQAANLKAWYKLNQSANWEADTTGNWQIPDAVSAYPQSFKFNETQDYIEGDLNLDGGKVHAVSFWIKNKQASGLGYVLSSRPSSYGPGFAFIVRQSDTTGYIFSNVRDTPTTTQSNASGYQSALGIPRDDNWHHVVFTHSIATGQLKAYIDGVYKYQRLPQTRTDSATINPLKISSNQSVQDFGGYISNVMVWEDVVLTDGGVALNDVALGEIAQVYNNGVPITSASVQSDKLKGWYKLDNTEIFDGTNWTIENQAYPANFESALDFNSSQNDYIDFGDVLHNDGQTPLTVSGWVKITTAAGHTSSAPLANKKKVRMAPTYAMSGWAVNFVTSGSQTNRLHFELVGDTTSATGTIAKKALTLSFTDGLWHHAVVTYDGSGDASGVKFYIDGIEDTNTQTLSNSFSGTLANDPTVDFQIGKVPKYGGTNYMDGQISNVSIFNTALDSTAVQALYNNGTPETSISSSPVSWWKLDNTTTGIKDSVGSNNGTNNGTTKVNTFVSTEVGISSGMTEQNLVNNNVSVLNGESVGMNTTNLVQSNLTRTQPFSNYSINFDSASSDYINIYSGTIGNLPSQFSIGASDSASFSFWIKSNTTSSNNFFYTQRGSAPYLRFYQNYISGDDSYRVYFRVRDDSSVEILESSDSTNIVNRNQWNHIVGIIDRNASKLYVYVNGVVTGTGTSLGSLGAITQVTDVAIAGDPYPSGSIRFPFDGQISNCSIFNTALNQDDVINMYNNGITQDLNNFRVTPVAWYPMDQSYTYFNGSVLVARDVISSNDGTGVNIIKENIEGNAPGSSVNGIGTNLTIASLEGNMYNSDKNAHSINMGDYASGTNPANSGRSTDTP